MGVLYARVGGTWVPIAVGGVPPGGAPGTVLTKSTANDFDTVWSAAGPRGVIGFSQITANPGAIDTTAAPGLVIPGLQINYTADGTRRLRLHYHCFAIAPSGTGLVEMYLMDNFPAGNNNQINATRVSFQQSVFANSPGIELVHSFVPAAGAHVFTIRGRTSAGT